MARYQVILAYDGTAFSGMQRQVNARTVQGEVETALTKIGWQGASILAAGRTDSGVHASGQVIAFDLNWAHSLDELHRALNATLPQDVAARVVLAAAEDFHPRYDAVSRTYRYQMFYQPHRDPLRERYAWRVRSPVAYERLDACAEKLIGEHDFSAFGTPPKEGGATVRRVITAGWQQEGDSFTFEVTANAYLYHMVRRMVSLQVDVGQGRLAVDEIDNYLTGENPEMIQGLAPPQGLFLMQVRYPPSS